MRIIAGFDPHLKGVNPESRIDHYPSAILFKLMEMGRLAKQYKVDCAVITGDLCDIPRISTALTGMLARILRDFECPIYIVPGNHDLPGHNIKGIEHTTLGLLANTGIVNLLTRQDMAMLTDKSGLKVSLQGQEFHIDMDKRNPILDYGIQITDANYHVLVAHGNLLDKPGHPDMPATLIKDISAGPDVILCGHWHPGLPNAEIQAATGPLVINPGSMARVSATADCLKRQPQVVVLEFTPTEIIRKYIDLQSAKPVNEVLDIGKITSKQANEQHQQSFSQALQRSNFKAYDLPKLITDLAQANSIPANLIKQALDGLQDAEISQEGSDKLDGYIDKQQSLWITEVELFNFQSHEHTLVKFKSGLNTIVGESNSGKTSILRAIRWCLENQPKGNSMIRAGTKNTKVIVRFSDGTAIIRERTIAKAGTWTVQNPDGTEIPFKGWKTTPIEIINGHQMPEVALSKGNKANLNIQRQLDPAFLIGASPADRAAVIGRLTGLHIVDAAIKEKSRQIVVTQRDNKATERQLADKNLQLKDFADLSDLEKQIDMARISINLYDKLKLELDDLTILSKEFNYTSAQLEQNKIYYSSLPDYNQADYLLNQAELVYKEFVEFYDILTDSRNVEQQLQTAIAYNNAFPDYKEAESILNHIESLHIETTELNNLLQEDRSICLQLKTLIKQEQNQPDFVKLQNKTEQADFLIRELTELEIILDEYKQCNNTYDRQERTLHAIETTLQQDMDEYRQILAELKVCPTCFSELTDEKIDLIIGRDKNDSTNQLYQ